MRYTSWLGVKQLKAALDSVRSKRPHGDEIQGEGFTLSDDLLVVTIRLAAPATIERATQYKRLSQQFQRARDDEMEAYQEAQAS